MIVGAMIVGAMIVSRMIKMETFLRGTISFIETDKPRYNPGQRKGSSLIYYNVMTEYYQNKIN